MFGPGVSDGFEDVEAAEAGLDAGEAVGIEQKGFEGGSEVGAVRFGRLPGRGFHGGGFAVEVPGTGKDGGVSGEHWRIVKCAS